MKLISDVLAISTLSDAHRTCGGWLAIRRTDVAPLAYEVVVNDPLTEATVESLVEFAGNACPAMVRELYRLCNGLRVGATKFAVYGVSGESIDRSDVGAAVHIPFDINIPNLYERPVGWPESTLLVAASSEVDNFGNRVEAHHGITEECKVLVKPEHQSSSLEREYTSIDDWLRTEVDRALSDRTRF